MGLALSFAGARPFGFKGQSSRQMPTPRCPVDARRGPFLSWLLAAPFISPTTTTRSLQFASPVIMLASRGAKTASKMGRSAKLDSTHSDERNRSYPIENKENGASPLDTLIAAILRSQLA